MRLASLQMMADPKSLSKQVCVDDWYIMLSACIRYSVLIQAPTQFKYAPSSYGAPHETYPCAGQHVPSAVPEKTARVSV
jgi:hypothetical protein